MWQTAISAALLQIKICEHWKIFGNCRVEFCISLAARVTARGAVCMVCSSFMAHLQDFNWPGQFG
jgi:hypothetical protein